MKNDSVEPGKIRRSERQRIRVTQLAGAMDSFAAPKRPKTEDLEVTGVSRCGRVRKKSSKLVDFDSKNEQQQQQQQIDNNKSKKLNLKVHFQDQFDIDKMVGNVDDKKRKSTSLTCSIINNTQKIKNEILSETETSETEFEDSINTNDDEDNYSMESPSEEEIDPLLIDDKFMEFNKLEAEQNELPSSQAQSLYMMEKCRKKICVKDGKIVGRTKAQRKDKGKTRFTAYMLWAKEIRQELLEKCPYMDFSAISKRLGELWATVPHVEKYNWRRRAKRLADSPKNQVSIKDESVWKTPAPSPKKKFINKLGNGKESKSPSPPKKQLGILKSSQMSQLSPTLHKSTKLVNEPVIGSGMYKVIGTQPVDVAAHLKLLGESLTIIGERLKEHDGQIAVSGSLSVLLDSLLCALGPLMCLTQQIPETDVVRPEIFSDMLDNIAYIMPGL